MTLLTRIVTPNFVAFNAHCWFAYAFIVTFAQYLGLWVFPIAVIGAGFKEFYIDKHFEGGQSFDDNLLDFFGYVTGAALAYLAAVFLP